VLSSAHRLSDGASFREAVRTGRRSGTRTVVVHLAVPATAASQDAALDGPPARVGFVVSKAVGNAVVRNRVKRRLRHLAREHVSSLPGSAVLVVRALPASATATSAELARDLARGLSRAVPSQEAGR
jgi:ribonuclease P protein component